MNLGSESSLSSFRRKEAKARVLTDRNTLTKMTEGDALEVLDERRT